jgi:unsaturated chondroitin disaccharide hydrolase
MLFKMSIQNKKKLIPLMWILIWFSEETLVMHIMEKIPCNTADEKLLSHEEMLHALELMIHRMDATNANCANGFPLYSPGSTDQWVVSPGGSWVGGFWAGCWWLRAKVTESRSDQHKASDICQRLDNKISADSINRSMIFWYGAAPGDSWFSDENAQKLVGEAVAALAASYDPEIQCIPVGTDMGGGKDGNRLITIDTFAPLIQLFSRSEYSKHEYISR